MDNLSFLLGLNANNGGGGGSTPTWSEITGKPFSTVDTTNGLTIVDGTLMLETLDHVATIDYVDTQINGVTSTLETDYALKSELPTVPTNVSSFNNDAGYVTSSITTGLATEAYVNAATTALNIPDAVSISNTLQSGTAIADVTIGNSTTTLYAPAGGGSAPTPNWNATSGQDGYIDNKPDIKNGNGMNGALYIGTGGASGNGAIAIGRNVYGKGLNTVAIGKDIMNSFSPSSYPNEPNMFFGVDVNPYISAPTIPTQYRGYHSLNANDLTTPSAQYLDIIGNGVSNSRSNAEATDWDGNKYLAGNIYTNVTNWANPQSNSIQLANIEDIDPSSVEYGDVANNYTYYVPEAVCHRIPVTGETTYTYENHYQWADYSSRMQTLTEDVGAVSVRAPEPDIYVLQEYGTYGTWEVSLKCTVDYFDGDESPSFTYFWAVDSYTPAPEEPEPDPEEEGEPEE